MLEKSFVEAANRAAASSIPDGALAVNRVEADFECYAGADAAGRWTLVIPTDSSDSHEPSVRLQALNVDYNLEYQLEIEGQISSKQVSTIQCRVPQQSLRVLFAIFCTSLLSEIATRPNVQRLSVEVNKWISLFWHLQAPSKTDAIGLIGELMLLDHAPDLSRWVNAWHSSKTDNLDFAFDSPPLSVEVKATSGVERVHSISLSQVVEPPVGRSFIASVKVELRGSGQTIRSLVESISSRLFRTEDLRYFWAALTDICGKDLEALLDEKFMSAATHDSLEFYAVDVVPRPNVSLPLPAGVSSVRFRSDLSGTPQTPHKEVLCLTQPVPHKILRQ